MPCAGQATCWPVPASGTVHFRPSCHACVVAQQLKERQHRPQSGSLSPRVRRQHRPDQAVVEPNACSTVCWVPAGHNAQGHTHQPSRLMAVCPCAVLLCPCGCAGKEYSKADSRYATRDDFVISMEAVTAFLEGPGCLLICWAMLKCKPWRFTAILLVSLGQLYGDVLYFGTCLHGGRAQCSVTAMHHCNSAPLLQCTTCMRHCQDATDTRCSTCHA